MNYKILSLSVILLLSFTSVAFAQGISEDSIEESMSPLISLVGGVSRVVWRITQLFIGKDDVSIAYFTHQLGFRSNEVTMTVKTNDGVNEIDEDTCGIGSFKIDEESGLLNCTNLDKNNVYVIANDERVNVSKIEDINDDGSLDLTDAFDYLINGEVASINIAKGAQVQVMLFAIILPLTMFAFLLNSFFTSVRIFSTKTNWVMSISIALLVARTGVYTGLLTMVSNLFGGGGFFMSMFSIYLLIAILLWFYGGFVKSKKYAEATEEVTSSLLRQNQLDLNKATQTEDAIKKAAKEKEK